MESWATVNIDLNKFIDICSNGRKSKEKLLEDFKIMNDKNIHEIFGYRKFNDGFTSKLTCYNDGKHVIGSVSPSYKEFLEKIFNLLNVNPDLKYLIGKDDDRLTEVLMARIEMLRTVQNTANLQCNFPMLYRDLQDGRKYINAVEKGLEDLEKDTTKTKEEKAKEKQKLEKQKKYFYQCAMSGGFTAFNPKDGFIYKQVELYTRFVRDRKKYKELIETKHYDAYLIKNFDETKMALYIVDGYLKAINAIDNRDKQVKYYNLVEKFLNNSKVKKDVEIVIDGRTINYEDINKRAKIAHSKINRVDIKLEWELLPIGSGFVYKGGSGTSRRASMSEEEKQRLIGIGKEQTEFFMNSKYSAKAIGLKKFAGYFAYIYPNGIVVLEKDFREKYPTTAEGAIYIMKAQDFELLSAIGKTDLIYHPLLLGHKYHSGDWKTKIEAFINKKGTLEDEQAAQNLIHKMEEEQNKRSR